MDKKEASAIAAEGKTVALKSGAADQIKHAPKRPDTFSYLLSTYVAERRKDGWRIARSTPSFGGEKPKWSGPFQTIEHACLSIARHCAVELADRHTRSIESYGIERTDGLFGLKPTTRLRRR